MSLAQSSSLTGGSVWHPTMEASCWRMEDSGACFSWMGDVPRQLFLHVCVCLKVKEVILSTGKSIVSEHFANMTDQN